MATVAPAPSPPTADRILFSIFSSGSVLFSRFLAFFPSGSDCVYGGFFIFFVLICVCVTRVWFGSIWVFRFMGFLLVFVEDFAYGSG